MRTLVISDLHLGARTGADVLQRAGDLDALAAALPGFDRLVLLGDVVELRHGPVREVLAAAEPVLAAIGAALGPEREVVIVPGNHDHRLAAEWLERRAQDGPPAPLGLESSVDFSSSELLGRLSALLAPARVRAAYPGVWLREDVYAAHGHYCDRHTTVPMVERLGAGAMARVVREPASGPHTPEDYEAVLAPIYAWIHAIAQTGAARVGGSSHGPSSRAWRAMAGVDGRGGLRRRGMIAAFPLLIGAVNRAGLGPVRADISGPELRRAGVRAFAEVLSRLDVRAEYVIFGHTHRAGPLERDDRAEWLARGGAALVNCGSWVLEPQFLGRSPGRSPYRPGFAVAVGAEGPPELVNLLD